MAGVSARRRAASRKRGTIGTRMRVPGYPSNREADESATEATAKAGRCASRMRPSRETCLHRNELPLAEPSKARKRLWQRLPCCSCQNRRAIPVTAAAGGWEGLLEPVSGSGWHSSGRHPVINRRLSLIHLIKNEEGHKRCPKNLFPCFWRW